MQNSELDRESANICRPPPRPRRPPSYPWLTRSSFRGVAKVYLMGTAHFSKEKRDGAVQVETEPGEVSFTNKLSAKHVLLTRRSVSVADTNEKTRPDG